MAAFYCYPQFAAIAENCSCRTFGEARKSFQLTLMETPSLPDGLADSGIPDERIAKKPVCCCE
jgi:hypothetical protein